MSSLDDIFMVSDTEEEEEDNESFRKDTETSSQFQIKPVSQTISIPKEKEESSNQKQSSEIEITKKENKKQNKSIKPIENVKPENQNKKELEKNNQKPKENKSVVKNQKREESSEASQSYQIFEISESSEKRYNQKPKNKRVTKKNNDDFDFEINSQVDYSEKIDQLRRLIDERNQQFETEFEDLKSKHSEKLAILKQNNLSHEQSLSSSFDLEYRNVIWTTTLHHLKRGCFSENIGLLFQQAVNDEQFQLEKELIELKQKNEEELAYYRSRMPDKRAKRIIRKRRGMNILNPREMANFINNKFISENDIDDFDFNIVSKIDSLISKIQKETNYLTINDFNPSPKKIGFSIQSPLLKVKKVPKRSKSPRMIQNEEHRKMLKKHQKACNHLQKSVKKTDKYIKEMQENDWFQDMFPHVE